MASFREYLELGQEGEKAIAMFLRKRGYSILPVYEKISDDHKGPRLFLPDDTKIAPDLFVFRMNDDSELEAYWIEAKRKDAFSWHRNSGRWVTGVDLRHYRDYCSIDEETPWRVWLFFLHLGGQAKDSPAESPTGLYGGDLQWLKTHENHRGNWGNSGMVYWNIDSLHKLATLEDLGINQNTNAVA